MAELTAERARQLVSYDPHTGLLTWKCAVYRTIKPGQPAGCLRKDGRYLIRLDGRLYYGYRVAWLITYGEWPAEQVDHINGDQTDNRLANLRAVSNKVNGQNKRRAARRSKTGLLGASPAACEGEIGRFVAFIGHGAIRKNLGYFDTPEEAHEAYVTAKRVMHRGCTI